MMDVGNFVPRQPDSREMHDMIALEDTSAIIQRQDSMEIAASPEPEIIEGKLQQLITHRNEVVAQKGRIRGTLVLYEDAARFGDDRVELSRTDIDLLTCISCTTGQLSPEDLAAILYRHPTLKTGTEAVTDAVRQLNKALSARVRNKYLQPGQGLALSPNVQVLYFGDEEGFLERLEGPKLSTIEKPLPQTETGQLYSPVLLRPYRRPPRPSHDQASDDRVARLAKQYRDSKLPFSPAQKTADQLWDVGVNRNEQTFLKNLLIGTQKRRGPRQSFATTREEETSRRPKQTSIPDQRRLPFWAHEKTPEQLWRIGFTRKAQAYLRNLLEAGQLLPPKPGVVKVTDVPIIKPMYGTISGEGELFPGFGLPTEPDKAVKRWRIGETASGQSFLFNLIYPRRLPLEETVKAVESEMVDHRIHKDQLSLIDAAANTVIHDEFERLALERKQAEEAALQFAEKQQEIQYRRSRRLSKEPNSSKNPSSAKNPGGGSQTVHIQFEVYSRATIDPKDDSLLGQVLSYVLDEQSYADHIEISRHSFEDIVRALRMCLHTREYLELIRIDPIVSRNFTHISSIAQQARRKKPDKKVEDDLGLFDTYKRSNTGSEEDVESIAV